MRHEVDEEASEANCGVSVFTPFTAGKTSAGCETATGKERSLWRKGGLRNRQLA